MELTIHVDNYYRTMMTRYWSRAVTMEFIHTLQCIYRSVCNQDAYEFVNFNSILEGFVIECY